MGNDRLKWESTVQYNIGYDLSLFNSRISITADAYHKTTSDLLLNAQLPYLTGYASAFKNVGRISNRGLELSLHTVNVRRGSFAWESSFNISFNRNKVLALTDNQERLLSSVSWTSNYNNSFLYIAEVGWPAGRFYGYLSDGIYQFSDFNETSPGVYVLKDEVPANGNTRQSIQPGDAKYVDMDGDGTVSGC